MLDDVEAANSGSPIVIAEGGSFTFTYTTNILLDAGQSQTNVVTVTGKDDEDTLARDTDDHTITGTNVAPAITIDKTGPATVAEGGEDVTWNFVITAAASNASTDPVTVTSVNDDKLGDLTAAALAANSGNPIVLNPGQSFSFSYNPTGNLVLDAGQSQTNVVTVTGKDDEDTPASDTDDHTITGTDAGPSELAITIVKTVDANKDGIFGDSEFMLNADGTATYKYQVTNTSKTAAVDPLTIKTLNDDSGDQ